MILPKFTVDDIIITALKEDINYIDAATDLTLDEQNIQQGVFLAKASGVLCGIDAALRVFELLSDKFEYSVYKKDGDRIEKGDIIAEIKGPVTFLLKGERTASTSFSICRALPPKRPSASTLLRVQRQASPTQERPFPVSALCRNMPSPAAAERTTATTFPTAPC